MIDFNFENNSKPKAGSILVSEPFLSDDYFSRSVIFLCDHNSEGSYGFVLNKYVKNDIGDFIPDFPNVNTKLSLGGPVETSNLFYVHSMGDEIKDSHPCANNLFIGGNFKTVRELFEEDPSKANNLRFFIGYSGWSEGQLDKEIEEKSWIVLNNISPEQILDTSSESYWKDLMENLGGKFKVMSSFPVNPSDN
ncbi:MAG: YqgE/AlgH family protein [Crocinitomicaceae bacterium]|nr:YqgE/AlgH family protein [Crocinitomicaceae bacterium]